MKTKNEIVVEVKLALLKKHNINKLNDEFINDCAEIILKAVGYSCRSTKLKSEPKMNFGNWKDSRGLRYLGGNTYSDDNGRLYDADCINEMYDKYYDL
jgi:hypothetical protein